MPRAGKISKHKAMLVSLMLCHCPKLRKLNLLKACSVRQVMQSTQMPEDDSSATCNTTCKDRSMSDHHKVHCDTGKAKS